MHRDDYKFGLKNYLKIIIILVNVILNIEHHNKTVFFAYGKKLSQNYIMQSSFLIPLLPR